MQKYNIVKEIQYDIKKNVLEIYFIYERSNKEAGVDDHPVGWNTAKMDFLRQTVLKRYYITFLNLYLEQQNGLRYK